MAQAKKARKKPLTRIQRTQKAKRSAAQTLSFRMDDEYLAKLDVIGAKRGNSIHEQAREILMALLDGDDAELIAVRLKVEELGNRFEIFTAGMADTMEAMLMMSGASEEKARAWVNERLRRGVIH